MSGHSKWSKVKHQKAVTDLVKSSAFTKASRAITLAVKEGGNISDPDKNFKLRLAVEQARDVNMPKDTISRAIERAIGTDAQSYHSLIYEAYGPGKTAMLIESLTDNTNRTVNEVKNILERNGGIMVTQGALKTVFEHRGVINIDNNISFDKCLEHALNSGALDVKKGESDFEIFTSYSTLFQVKDYFEKQGITASNASLIYFPLLTVKINETDYDNLQSLVDKLDALDDVQRVWTNNEAI